MPISKITGDSIDTSTGGTFANLTLSSVDNMQLNFQNLGDSNRGGRMAVTGSAGTGTFSVNTTSSGYSLTFGIDNSEKGRFDTSGNFKLSAAGTKILNSSGNPILQQTGSVLQVVQATYGTSASTTSGSFVATGLSATITPSATTSKILIISREQMNGDIDNDGLGDATGQYALYRNGSAVVTSVAVAFARGGLQRINDGGFKYLDSPATISAVTYATYIRMTAGSRAIVTNNDGLSTMILLEIAA
jgi:hypothetical protein